MSILRQRAPVIIDHVFICTDAGAPEGQRLVDFGLSEGPPNTHPGQGTANRRFFFESTMLELLWVSDAAEAHAPITRPTLLWERWSRRRAGACPFGIILRPAGATEVPFPAWEYRPSYVPAPHAMHVASDATLEEPMWIYAPFLQRRSGKAAHRIGIGDITRVRLTSPRAAEARVARRMADVGVVDLTEGAAHLLELEFDRGYRGLSADFQPDLPLAFRW